MLVSIYYKPSLFNAHTMIFIVHIFMNVNKLCLNHLSAPSGSMNFLSLPPAVSCCFSSCLTGSSNVSETTQPEYSLPVTKTWACFSASTCTPLGANLSTNQLLISSICFSSVTGLIGSRKPCWHPQYLCSFPTTPFLLWHSSVSNPFCQSKLPGQRSFAYQGPTVWNKLPHNIRHASSTASFKTALKTQLCCQQNVSQYISVQKSG